MILDKILEYILVFFYSLTSSYGISIILLSLAVTIIMLPLFWIAELLQKQEKLRKAKFQPDLDKIKNLENKKEKYYYTREIYRKHNYSPYNSLIGLLGLAIQIPFFIAAFVMLENFTSLSGVSFGIISDLYSPDGLLSIGSMSVNILPFAMTFFNLLSAYLYAKNMDKSEKRQLVIIAFVFLILLYNLSAALVLYWTMNNVFSIGKNWLMRRLISSDKYNVSDLKVMKFTNRVFNYIQKNIYLLFPILFSIYPLLSFYNHNISELYFAQILPLLGIIPIALLICLLPAIFIYNNKNKIAIFGFLIIILIFSFGHVFELIRHIDLSQKYLKAALIAIYTGFFLIASFTLYRTKINLKVPVRVLKVFSVCLLAVVLFNIGTYKISKSSGTIHLTSDQKSSSQNETGINVDDYPDIYYIILDGYANSQILQDVLQFDNSKFEDKLNDRQFYVASDSRCNYVTTFISLAATFNMEYVNYLQEQLGSNNKDRTVANKMFWDSKVFEYLKSRGYQTINISSGWGATTHNSYSDYNFAVVGGIDEFTGSFLQTTILYPIIKYFSDAVGKYQSNILYAFDKLSDLDEIKGPKFAFAHVVCPHPPYVFNENGKINTQNFKWDNKWDINSKDLYIGQLKYMNLKTSALIDAILAKNKNSVIIIQSDHGSAFKGQNTDWNEPDKDFIRERSLILNAMYLPDLNYTELHSKISSVNTFRILFNNIFNDSLEILDDKTYFSDYETPYKFIDVTNDLDNE